MTEESHYMKNISLPILKIKDIDNQPELQLERYNAWIIKIRTFLTSQNGYDSYIDKTAAEMVTEYLAMLNAPTGPGVPVVRDPAISLAAAVVWSAIPRNRTLTLAKYRELTTEADREVVIGEAARIYQEQLTAEAKAKVDAHEAKIVKFRKDEAKCYAFLVAALEESLVIKYQIDMLIAPNNTPHNLWRIIHEDFMRFDEATRLILTERFNSLKFNNNETIREFAIRIRVCSNNLQNIGIIKTEGDIKSAFLSGLNLAKQFKHLLPSAFTYDQTFPLETLAAKLQSASEIMGIDQFQTVSFKNTKRPRDEIVNPQAKRHLLGLKSNKNDIECFYCHQHGHISRECRIKKRDIKNGNNRDQHKHRKVVRTSTSSSTAGETSINNGDFGANINKTEVNKRKRPTPAKINIRVTKMMSNKKSMNANRIGMVSENVQIILDTGAETTVLKEDYGILSDIKNESMTLIYGNNEQDITEKSGSIGFLEDIAISNKVSDNILSLSQMADIGHVSIITADGIYIMKPQSQFEIIGEEVALFGHRFGNLYKCDLTDINKILTQIHDQVEEMSESGDTASENNGVV